MSKDESLSEPPFDFTLGIEQQIFAAVVDGETIVQHKTVKEKDAKVATRDKIMGEMEPTMEK